MLHAISARELRANFREYLESAEQGTQFVVLTRGRPIAILRPVRPDDEGVLVSVVSLRAEIPTAITRVPDRRLIVMRFNHAIAVLEAAPKELIFVKRDEEEAS